MFTNPTLYHCAIRPLASWSQVVDFTSRHLRPTPISTLYQINSTHVVTKKGILLWVVIPWSIHFWAAITEQAPTIILPRTVTGNTRKKLIYVKNGYLATLLYGSGNPEHRSVFKIFPFNSSSSKMLVKTQNSCSQIN